MESKTERIALAILLIAVFGMLVLALKDFFSFTADKINAVSSQKNVRSSMQFNFMDDELAKDERVKSANMGALGSQHIHADFKIFINGNPINFADDKHYMKSSVIHLDDQQNKEDASGLIHMHATGVPFWYFLKSVGADLGKECITLENQQKFCNSANKKFRFFVNGKEYSDIGVYVFRDMDKILISYGDETEEELLKQINSVTDYAKNH
ncbi:hypothetical protein HYW20_04415 [Candidatus Woesearchaeota archaeon]|nr:hypothetical protein [Candidatus Woesearchaeota archaeon]